MTAKGLRFKVWGPGFRAWSLGGSSTSLLVHGWDRIKNVHVYSLLGLSTHKNLKCYPTITKLRNVLSVGLRARSCKERFGLADQGLTRFEVAENSDCKVLFPKPSRIRYLKQILYIKRY